MLQRLTTMNQEQEEFKKELFNNLKRINQKLNSYEHLSEDDLTILLMSSILEEES